MTPPGVANPRCLAWVHGGVQVKNVLCAVVPLLLFVVTMPSPLELT
jgi:hypothetical protein